MTTDNVTVSRDLLRQTIDLLDDMLAPGATFSTASLRAAVEQTAVEPVPLLTDEEVSHIAVANAIEFHEFARAIEAAVRQKAGIK